MQFDQIFIANSVYAEFLYLIKFPEKINRTLFIVGPSCAPIDVPNRLPMIGPRDFKNLPLFRQNLENQVRLLLNAQIVPCYGNVETIFSPFFINRMPFYPISDGLWDIVKFQNYLNDRRHFVKCYAVKYPGGLDYQNDRLEYIDIQKIWQHMSALNRKTLAQRFGVDDHLFNTLKKIKFVLLTQPLSEDGIIDEDEKIELYRSILSQYSVNKIIIKPHPREITDYRKYFPEIPVLSNLVPAELMSLLAPDIEKYVTFFSTAACSIGQPEKVDFYSKDFSKLVMMQPNRQKNGKQYRIASSFDIEKSLAVNPFNWLKIPNDKFYIKG